MKIECKVLRDTNRSQGKYNSYIMMSPEPGSSFFNRMMVDWGKKLANKVVKLYPDGTPKVIRLMMWKSGRSPKFMLKKKESETRWVTAVPLDTFGLPVVTGWFDPLKIRWVDHEGELAIDVMLPRLEWEGINRRRRDDQRSHAGA